MRQSLASRFSPSTIFRTSSALVVIAVVGLLTLPAFADIEREFNTGSGGTFTLDADGASVTIETTTGDTTSVWIERRRGNDPIVDDYTVSFEHSGSDVMVDIEKKRKMDWGRNSGLKVTVQMPQRMNVDVATSGGALKITDLDGQLVARTSGGSITLGQINGEVDAKTSGGSIKLTGSSVRADLSTSGGSITAGDVAGTVRARTSGGSISIERADGDVDASTSGGSIELGSIAGSINASTSGGSVSATFAAQPTEDSELRTSGGTVRVSLASGVGFDLDARASSGVSTEAPIEIRGSVERTKVQGALNGGGPALVVRASGGRVVISEK